ncbi:MAG TPA: proline dehydrogenase family protein [Candidatus Limnocylindria bacterium]|nr:proline dehydrogenase family protein [Candidatus Limnocylindria bacterium]
MSLFDRLVAASLPLVPKPVVRWAATPYIAGERLDDCVRVVRQMNGEGCMGAVSILGEFVARREEAEAAVSEYEQVLAAIARERLDATIHVKLTHFGLKLDAAFCYENMRRLLRRAQELGNFVRIDMEDSSCTDDTLALYQRLSEEFDNVGTVIQAYLRRTLADARSLARTRANLRLCKGIYVEPRAIAYVDRTIVQRNFKRILEELLGSGGYVAIATHDELLVWEAFQVIERLKLDPTRYEFQMLLGVEAPLRRIIRDAGHRLRVAVPFGPEWYPYSIRRLRRNPAIAGHVLRALLKK